MRKLKVEAGVIHQLAFSPDGRTLAVAEGAYELVQSVRWLDLETGAETDVVEINSSRVALTADQKRLARIDAGIEPEFGSDHPIQVWDRAAKHPGWETVPIYPDDGGSLTFSADGRFLAVGDFGVDRVMVWDFRVGRAEEDLPSLGPVAALAFSADGGQLAAGDANNGVRVWDRGGNRKPLDFKHKAWARQVAFAPDGSCLAAAVGKVVALWELPGGGARATLKGHTGWVSGVAFAPDGRSVITAGQDRSVKLWDAATGRLRQSFDWGIGRVGAVAFSPDGLTVAAGGEKGRVVIWDVDEG